MSFDSIKQKTKTPEKIEQPNDQVVITAYYSGDRASRREVIFSALLGMATTTLAIFLFFTLLANYSYVTRDNKAVNLPNNDSPVNFKRINTYDSSLRALTKIGQGQIEAELKAQIAKIGIYNDVYAKAEKRFHVSRQILAAVHFVESRQSGDTDRKSSAGAIGPMQFMPGTFDAYAQDGDGDGKKLITDVEDAIFSAAKNLAANGAANGQVAAALYNYNHSYEYVLKVLEVAKNFGYLK